ncbi:MAG TPA: hypothetical protein VE642_00610, partial [Pyrinomonadaceae bacterium]|nr:hypothetical protein [Pyrinomonadaceae bacterium]
DAPTGYSAINLTVNGNSGSWVTIEDVVIRNNIIRHVSDAINIGKQATSAKGRNIRIHNNLFYDIDATLWDGGSGRFLTLSDLPGLVIDHNTVLNSGSAILVYGHDSGGYYANPGFVMTNNILNSGSSGIQGQDYGTGNDTFTVYFPDAIFQKNLLAGTYGNGSQYSDFAANNTYPNAITDAGFVNYDARNYRLAATLPNSSPNPLKNWGTDGRDVGADIDTVEWETGVMVTAPAAGMAFVNDSFTGASGTYLSSHTGETGASWTQHPSYSSNRIYLSNANRAYGDASSLYYASGTPATADYDVQAELTMVSADCTAGVAGRVSTSGDTYYRATYQPGNGEFYLERVSGGTVTTLQHLAPYTWGAVSAPAPHTPSNCRCAAAASRST